MKITGLNPFSATNQLQLLNELNLKEGQKIVGKIISLSTDEALLEIAGRPIQAKIEGTPPPAGTNQTFQVKTDDQGRILLKVLTNPAESTDIIPKNNPNTPVSNPGENSLWQKTILNSLAKEGLPLTPENVEKVFRYLQDFQAKFQHPINPQVISFIMAKKWPVTPGTILAAWVFQDQELRDTLWNKLKNMLPEKEAANLQKLLLQMKSDPSAVESRLKAFVGEKLPELLQKLNKMIQSTQTNSQSNLPANQLPTKLFLLNELKMQMPLSDNYNTQSKAIVNPDKTENQLPLNPSDLKQPSISAKNIAPNQTKNVDQTELTKSNQDASNSKMTSIEKNVESIQAKVQSVLDQNISINQSLLKENALNGVCNLIPLLINDSQQIIHECMIKWREEPGSQNDGSVDQVVYMTVPTEKMGDIHLALRLGKSGTRINFQVDSEEVRRYFLQHTAELKTDLEQGNAVITINIKEKETSPLKVLGVDLWM